MKGGQEGAVHLDEEVCHDKALALVRAERVGRRQQALRPREGNHCQSMAIDDNR